MKRKLSLSLMLLLSLNVFATTYWTVTTSCGKTAKLQTSDNISDAQLKEYLVVINYDLCSTIPKHITIRG